MTLVGTRAWVVAGGVLVAAATGALLPQPGARGVLLVGALALGALTILGLETPVVVFGLLALVVALASEEARDDRLLGIGGVIYDSAGPFNVPIVLLGVLLVSLAFGLPADRPRWPGAPATAALALLLVALGASVWFGPIGDNLFVSRPLVVLMLAILVGYWIALRYGSQMPLRALVWAAAISLPVGLYNSFGGEDVSYYDASFVFLIGVACVLVVFRAVEIGILYVPFVFVSLLVIALSLRRGAILAVAITFLLTGLIVGRGGFRWACGAIVVAVVTAELLAPGIVYHRVEGLVGYFSGASGQDFSVNYRRHETENAWINVERNWLGGIGPSTDWTQYRTFDGRFTRLGPDYLHNSYLWVWLRYGLLGLITYVGFFLVTAGSLVRRREPVASVVVGTSMIGLLVALGTASYLTTTTRWPLIVGLIVGIAAAAKGEAMDSSSVASRTAVTEP